MTLQAHNSGAINPNSMQKRILSALKHGDLTCSEVTRALNCDDQYQDLTVFQVRSWLLTLRDMGEVIEKDRALYGLPRSSPSPEPEAA